jgi:hypothetical protein
MKPMTEPDLSAERRRIIKGRNRAVALILVGLAALFYAVTLVQFGK